MLRNLRFFELTFGEKYAFKITVMLFNFYSYIMPSLIDFTLVLVFRELLMI